MNTNNITDPDELGNHIRQAFWDAEAAHERAEEIDKIGTLVSKNLETAIWPGTKEVLNELLQHCGDLYEVASDDLDDARRRHEVGRHAYEALQEKREPGASSEP